jgi:hypothetical protein
VSFHPERIYYNIYRLRMTKKTSQIPLHVML